uniref:BTB domain-containing protein n=1 Tax=Clytia hemisphaerica TaxID=252671 RepID=A0A7M5V3I0_9CNID
MMSLRSKKRTSQQSGLDNEQQPADKTSKQNNNDEDENMFVTPWKGSDGVLVVEDKEIHIHTTVLSLASPVFEKMFNGDFEEAQTKRVVLKDKEYDLIEHMLRIIYPVQCRVDSDRTNILNHFQKLYKLSEEYFIEDIQQKIKSQVYLQSQHIQSIDHAFDLLEAAENTNPNTEGVKNNCMEFLEKNLQSWEELSNACGCRPNLSFVLQMELKGLLLGNLLKRMKPKVFSEEQDIKAEAFNIAAYMRHFGTNTEVLDSFPDQ